MQNLPFSKRHGLNTQEKEITIRNDAPQELREYIIQTIDSLGYSPSFSRDLICRILRKVPNMGNWSQYPNIYNEAVDLISDCDWFYVYDIIELVYNQLKDKDKVTFEN